MSLAVLASVQLNLLPALGILEGCGQLAVINRLRTVQAIAGSLVVWAAIAGGLGLWSLVGAAAVRLLLDGWLVLRHFRVFFGSLNDPAAAGAIAWRDEIWPLQWRVAVQSIITYFSLNMFSAVMFEYHDEGVAGRMGMTWSIVSTIQRAAFAWVETRRPLFGSLIAQGNFEQLDRIFGRLTRISVAVLAAGYVVFLLALIGLSHLDLWLARRLSERLLDLTPTAMLCLATVVLQVARCQNIYVRAQLGRRFGPSGAAVGYLATVVLLLAPWWWSIWQTARTQWHIPTDGHAAARSMPTGD